MERKTKLLVIDDDPAVTDFMRLKLGARYDVVALNEPRQVLEVALRERVDVIVCDIDMPNMDGGDVCKLLETCDETRTLPFLYLSAIVSAEDAVTLGQVGGHTILSKHAPVREIVDRIDAEMQRVSIVSVVSTGT